MSTFEESLEAMLERVVRKVMRECAKIAAAPPPADELVTMAAFARRRSISESTVRAAIRAGRLPAVKIGRAVRVRADAQIGEPAPISSASTNADTPRARAARILGRLQ
jgi:excisionase family DNA binding protein